MPDFRERPTYRGENLALASEAGGASSGPPVGTVYMWMTSTSPDSKHLVLQGQQVSRTTYPALFAAWGVQFGAGTVPRLSTSRT